jgi:hypothetical protein
MIMVKKSANEPLKQTNKQTKGKKMNEENKTEVSDKPCVECGNPIQMLDEEDWLWIDEHGPLCADCYDKHVTGSID